MRFRRHEHSKWTNRLAILLFATLLGCGHLFQDGRDGYATARDLDRPTDEIDLAGIERSGEKTDVIGEYWSRAFSSLGRDDTFALFAKKYDALAKQDQAEAEAALAGFRRLCRLRGSLEAFDAFWADERSLRETGP